MVRNDKDKEVNVMDPTILCAFKALVWYSAELVSIFPAYKYPKYGMQSIPAKWMYDKYRWSLIDEFPFEYCIAGGERTENPAADIYTPNVE